VEAFEDIAKIAKSWLFVEDSDGTWYTCMPKAHTKKNAKAHIIDDFETMAMTEISFPSSDSIFPILNYIENKAPKVEDRLCGALCLWFNQGREHGGGTKFVVASLESFEVSHPIQLDLRRKSGTLALVYNIVSLTTYEKGIIEKLVYEDSPPPSQQVQALAIEAPNQAPKSSSKRTREMRYLDEVVDEMEEVLRKREATTGSISRPKIPLGDSLLGLTVQSLQKQFYHPSRHHKLVKEYGNDFLNTIIYGEVIHECVHGIPKYTVLWDDELGTKKENTRVYSREETLRMAYGPALN